jgi:uncharacterized membrane protein YgdD (TMEM256/DUF423 family)
MTVEADMQRTFLAIAALFGLLAVAAGAFGAHALEARLTPERLAIFETAARYQMYHALALLAVAIVAALRPESSSLLNAAGWSYVAGTLVFCGTLYLLALGAPRWLGAITPIGGLAFLAGWALLGLAALRS